MVDVQVRAVQKKHCDACAAESHLSKYIERISFAEKTWLSCTISMVCKPSPFSEILGNCHTHLR